MKATILKYPWAQDLLIGSLKVLTRPDYTSHRGKLLIVTGDDIDRAAMSPADIRHDWDFGCAICIVNVKDCRPMMEDDEAFALTAYDSRRFAWVLSDAVRIDRPFKVKLQSGIFDVNVPNGMAIEPIPSR